MSSEKPKSSRLRFLLVATYAWAVVSYVAVLTKFGIYSTLTPAEFKDYVIENQVTILSWAVGITFGGVILTWVVREVWLGLRRG